MANPSPAALQWALDHLARGAQLQRVTGLREGGAPWLVEAYVGGLSASAVLRTGDPGDAELAGRYATEVAALGSAEAHGIRAPRVLAADLTGADFGEMALLLTVVPGASRVPMQAPPGRMSAMGVAVAELASAQLQPTAALPARTRSLAGVDFASLREPGSAPLLDRADEAVAALDPPGGPSVLVHGDLWQGNTMWVDGSVAAIIDWDFAGAGPHGVDLGNVRLDAAILFGGRAAGDLLAGWVSVTGHPPDALPYWDLVAALSMPPTFDPWLAPIHDQGRTDLDGPTMNARRDSFVAAALAELGR